MEEGNSEVMDKILNLLKAEQIAKHDRRRILHTFGKENVCFPRVDLIPENIAEVMKDLF